MIVTVAFEPKKRNARTASSRTTELMKTMAVIRGPLRFVKELALLVMGGVVTVRLPFEETGCLAGGGVGGTVTLRACGGGWISGCGSRFPGVGGVIAPDGRAEGVGVIRVG